METHKLGARRIEAQNTSPQVRADGYGVAYRRIEGRAVLGVGGDNSPWGAGVFYEGAITAGYAGQATDEAVAANVVSAGYRV